MTAEQLIETLQKMIDSHSISPSAKIVHLDYYPGRMVDLIVNDSFMSRNTVILEEE